MSAESRRAPFSHHRLGMTFRRPSALLQALSMAIVPAARHDAAQVVASCRRWRRSSQPSPLAALTSELRDWVHVQKVLHVLIAAGVLAMTFDAFSGVVQSARDEAAIRDVQARQQDAWNRHGARAYAALFTVEGDVVNVLGWWWKGRREIEHQLTAAFAMAFHESRLTIGEVDVRFLTPQIAVAHVRWTLEGAKLPPPLPEPRQGIQLQVLEKRHGTWLIASFQNTSGVPEMPFPSVSVGR